MCPRIILRYCYYYPVIHLGQEILLFIKGGLKTRPYFGRGRFVTCPINWLNKLDNRLLLCMMMMSTAESRHYEKLNPNP
ncbi:hypothetical protein ISS30_03140 [bacterium]|nr:hypothetical protein [bacterium]